MTVEVPHEVALFLNLIGVPYPDIDEDQIRELARQVRDFATRVADTHESATSAIQQMGSVYSGYSYEGLVAAWARMSADHMASLDHACRIAAQILDATAQVIVVVKTVVLVELTALASGYLALMAASAATAGGSAVLAAMVRQAVTRVVSSMEQMLLGYIVAEVIGKAIEPLEDVVSRIVMGVVGKVAHTLDVPPRPNNSALFVEPDEVLRYAQVLDDYADDILDHAVRFADNVAALDFTTSSRPADPGHTAQWTPPGPAISPPPESTDRAPVAPVRADALSAPPPTDVSPLWPRADVSLPQGLDTLPLRSTAPLGQSSASGPDSVPGQDSMLGQGLIPARGSDERTGIDASQTMIAPVRSSVGFVPDAPAEANGGDQTGRSGIQNMLDRSAYAVRDMLGGSTGSMPSDNTDFRTADSAATDAGPHRPMAAPNPADQNAPFGGDGYGNLRPDTPNRPQADDIVQSTPWSRANRPGELRRSPQRPARRHTERRGGPAPLTLGSTPWSTKLAAVAPKTRVFGTPVDRPRRPSRGGEATGTPNRHSAPAQAIPKSADTESTP
ncbi:hypothetical protein [Nocardia cyriacigeorgica]|uniref:WXG100-like domain-containing protein n=1 Tax=Nocardia cyriacigeorgica TaxID=135487 RepID=UPI002453C9F8|nr:hypothetical protein [Nocardia cyriacigeorgica]